MRLNPLATELTTAATDAVLAALAVAGLLVLWRLRAGDRWKVGLWTWVLALLAVASALGAVAHGLDLPEATREALWQPLFLSLGLVVALFVVAAARDRLGERFARRLLPVMLVVGVGFYALTRLITGTFLVFILYEAAAMAAALALYLDLAARRRLAWAWLMAAGIVLNIGAAAVQATRAISFTLLWPFDHNGVFHLVQMAAVVVLVAGVARSLPRAARPELAQATENTR